MANVRIKWNIPGWKKLRSEPGVRADLERRGNAVLRAAGGVAAGYEMSSRQGAAKPQGRWRVSVAAVTPRAKRSNVKRNTLIRALEAGRG